MGADSRGYSHLQRRGVIPVILVERRLRGESSLLHELRELAEAAGYKVVGEVTQIRAPDPRYNIGEGKLNEILSLIKNTGAQKIIFFNELKPHQSLSLIHISEPTRPY